MCKMKFRKITSIVIFLLILTPVVYSLGLTSTFLGDNIGMYKGERLVLTFFLQNMVGEKDLNVKVELLEGSEVAKILDGPIIEVPYGRTDIPINLEINVPDNPKSEYQVAFMVKTIASPDQRTIQLSTGLEKRLKVVVGVNEERPSTRTVQTEPVPQPVIEEPLSLKDRLKDRQNVLLAIFLIIVIIILYKWVRKHKKKYDLKRLKDEFSF